MLGLGGDNIIFLVIFTFTFTFFIILVRWVVIQVDKRVMHDFSVLLGGMVLLQHIFKPT